MHDATRLPPGRVSDGSDTGVGGSLSHPSGTLPCVEWADECVPTLVDGALEVPQVSSIDILAGTTPPQFANLVFTADGAFLHTYFVDFDLNP